MRNAPLVSAGSLLGVLAALAAAQLVGSGQPGSSAARLGLRGGALAIDPSPPGTPVKLVFIHHSSGENWLGDDNGGLGSALADNGYFVSDTNYGWGPPDADAGSETIGDHTDLGHWFNWFAGPHRDTYLAALLAESRQHAGYARLPDDPGGPNRIVMFKSCFPNSNLDGSPNDPATTGSNPMRGEAAGSDTYTVANAKGIYNDILAYFATRQDVLWIAVTAPPLMAQDTDPARAANARAFDTWLVGDWLRNYPHANVAVFDFYNVLTSNGGSWSVNDLGAASGNHHRVRNGTIEYITSQGGNIAAYPEGGTDDHPSQAGNRKATGEFVPLLNVAYHRWTAGQAVPTPTASPSPTPGNQTIHRPRRQLHAQQQPASLACSGDQPPVITDLQIRQVPGFPEPAARAAFRDPLFGSCLVRVTDRTRDLAPGDTSGGLKNEYSKVQSFNADESLILVRGTAMTWYLYDAATLRPLTQLSPVEFDPRWDAADPNVLYYVSGPRLMRLDVRTQEPTVLHDFTADFPGQTLSFVWTKYEGSPSLDGRYWGLKADDENYSTAALLVYDQWQDRVVASRDMRSVAGAGAIDNVSISPLGDYLCADFGDSYCETGTLGTDATPCGYMVYDRNLHNGRGLLRIAGHLDLALDGAGREVAVYQDIDTDNLAMLDLATGAITNLLPLDFSQHSFGLHISGRAFGRPGWAVISTHDGDAASFTWMDKQVFLVELQAGGRVARLAHHHSLVDPNQEHDYWAEPQASTNRDLTKVLFTTNWGRSGTDQVEMDMIMLRSDWPARLR